MGEGHDHHHDHGHGHNHRHGENKGSQTLVEDKHEVEQNNVRRRLQTASGLCAAFILVEVVGGILAGSLTVLSDAAHLLADLASFMVALAASHYASKPASETYTFGYKRVEALAALFSVSSLALLSILLAVEGVRRIWLFVAPFVIPSHYVGDQLPDIDGKLMSSIATIGVLVNVALAFVLGEEGAQFHGHSHDHDHGEGCSSGGHGHSHGHGHENTHSSGNQHGTTTAHARESSACHSSHNHGHDHGEHTTNATETTGLLNKHKHDEEHGHHHRHHSHEMLHAGEVIPSDGEKEEKAKHNNGTRPANEHEKGSSSLVSSHVSTQRNINLHAAYLHVLGDLLQSISVLIAGIVIWIFPTWKIIDPICTILFCMIVLRSTFGTFKSSLSVLMEEVPPHLSWSAIYDAIAAVDGVSNVHDLHIWSVSHGRPALSVHVNATHPQRALVDISNLCHEQKIDHATIQIQPTVPGASADAKCISCSIGEGMEWSTMNPCITPDGGKNNGSFTS